MNRRDIVIIGSTGSIGRQTLDVVRARPDRFRVAALAAGQHTALLATQIAEFHPDHANWTDGAVPPEMPAGCRYLPLEEMAALETADRVMVAAAGTSGLAPTLAAVRAGKNVCLANKESIVTAGALILREAAVSGARLLPVDSEHSAVWQCLEHEREYVRRVWLTASGGPFHGYAKEQLQGVTAAQALAHPSWQMGPKVTIDSATLLNKGLEVIEARWLFDLDFDRIKVVVHPQSIVHSLVEFVDGSFKAQLSAPDMRLPIQYALSYPERLPGPGLPKLDWHQIAKLDFAAPDDDAFPGLALAVAAGRRGGTFPAVLCGADEAAVALFLEGRLKFTDITRMVARALEQHQSGGGEPDLEQVLAADAWARAEVRQMAQRTR